MKTFLHKVFTKKVLMILSCAIIMTGTVAGTFAAWVNSQITVDLGGGLIAKSGDMFEIKIIEQFTTPSGLYFAPEESDNTDNYTVAKIELIVDNVMMPGGILENPNGEIKLGKDGASMTVDTTFLQVNFFSDAALKTSADGGSWVDGVYYVKISFKAGLVFVDKDAKAGEHLKSEISGMQFTVTMKDMYLS